jgi:CheY-like chemotaxis protein
MLAQLVSTSGCALEIITDTDSSLQVTERVSEHSPKLIVMSVLPHEGLSLGRYLLRQLRIRFADTPVIVVSRWSRPEDLARDSAKLVELGATDVVGTVAEASDRIQKLVFSEQKTAPTVPAVGV